MRLLRVCERPRGPGGPGFPFLFPFCQADTARDPRQACTSEKRIRHFFLAGFSKELSAAPRVLAAGKKIKGINLENEMCICALNLFADSQMLALI